MTTPKIAAGTVIHSGEPTGRPAQQSCGAPKTTGAAATIHGHWSGRGAKEQGGADGPAGGVVEPDTNADIGRDQQDLRRGEGGGREREGARENEGADRHEIEESAHELAGGLTPVPVDAVDVPDALELREDA